MRKEKKKQASDAAAANSLDKCEQAVLFQVFAFYSFIHSFIYFDSGSKAHKDNRQKTIDLKRKTKVQNNRNIVDKWERTDIYVYDSNNFVLFCKKPFSFVVEIKYFCSTRLCIARKNAS